MTNGHRRTFGPILAAAAIVIAVLVVVVLLLRQPAPQQAPVARAPQQEQPAATPGLNGQAGTVAQARGLTPDDVVAALKTYMPTGKYDDYIMFASGGHAGQVMVIGMPSMRLLKVIGVFTPEPWQGWGYGADSTMAVLAEGTVNGHDLT